MTKAKRIKPRPEALKYAGWFEEEARRLKILARVHREGDRNIGPKSLFRRRMDMQGKTAEIDALAKKYREEGLKPAAAASRAYKEFGYDPATERHLWKVLIRKSRERLGIALGYRFSYDPWKRYDLTALERAFRDLPPNAPVEQEIAWVKSHELYYKAIRAAYLKVDKKFVVRVYDVGGRKVPPPSNGRPPSRGAVTLLEWAIQHPMKFEEKYGGKQTQVTTTKGMNAPVGNMGGNEELNRILANATRHVADLDSNDD